MLQLAVLCPHKSYTNEYKKKIFYKMAALKGGTQSEESQCCTAFTNSSLVGNAAPAFTKFIPCWLANPIISGHIR